jgi:putative tryptophan/tyrosine transport system substrate-binding protein
MSEDTGCAERFLCALFATAVKPIFDLRLLISGLCSLLFALCVSAEAQQAKKIPRIGFLVPGSAAGYGTRIEAFRKGLRDLKYVEGQNVNIEYRYAEGKLDRLSELAAELTRVEVDMIVTSGGTSVNVAKRATSTIPIVVANSDLVGTGHVVSLARPGGNITGLTNMAPELAGKRLELLKEVVPKLSLVAVLWRNDPSAPGRASSWKESQLAARELRLRLHSMEVQNPSDFARAFEDAAKARSDALAVTPSPLFSAHQKRITELAAKGRLPAIYSQGEYASAGGLMSYGPDVVHQYYRAATYVDKILKGTKPGDIPVEQPRRFEFIINLKAAKQIGLTIPPNVLARADKVIR